MDLSLAQKTTSSATRSPATVTTPGDWLLAYPPPRSLPLDQEGSRVFARAYYLGLEVEQETDPPVSFTTLMTALLEGEDDTSRWFVERAGQFGPDRSAVLAEKRIDEAVLSRVVATNVGQPKEPRLSKDKNLLTASARALLQNAESWAQRVGGSDIGVRHLVASFVLNPPANHREQLKRWQLKDSMWRSVFFDWVKERFTWESWADASQRLAPTLGVAAFEPRVKASTLAWPGDGQAMKVLERAAADHARREDRWLRLQTLLYAFIQTARTDEVVGAAVAPISNAIKAVGERYEEAYERYYGPGRSAPASVIPFANLEISPRVLNALETARELAAASASRLAPEKNGETVVNVLHLAGALLSSRVNADSELTALGLEPQKLRSELVLWAAQRGELKDAWREMLGEEEEIPFKARVIDLNSDDAEAAVRLDEGWSNDPLMIRPDVEAFAALLASTNLEPPLSIGLFGPWGSGKTTFLKRLRRGVDRCVKEPSQAGSGDARPYVSNVVHVEFNAWHFVEEALVSSLVDAILRAISGFIKDDAPVVGKKWSEQKRAALETTKRRVEAAEALRGAAQAVVADAEKNLKAAQTRAAETTASLQKATRATWQVVKAKLLKSSVVKDSGVVEAAGDIVKNADDLRDRLDQLRARPARMLGILGWPWSLFFAFLVLVVPVAAGWAINRWSGGLVGGWLPGLAAIMSIVGVWAAKAAKTVSRVDAAIRKVVDEYEQQIESDAGVHGAAAELETARANAEAAVTGLRGARAELASAESAAASAALPAQMLRLAGDRVQNLDYNKELTTLSLARADLEALSSILRDQRTGPDLPTDSTTGAVPGHGETVPPVRAVDRVILYIDDLDRCQPAEVVRVLQLVHMLLAFELFAVVVAVDARWVEEALMTSYPWFKKGDSGAVGGDAPAASRDDLRAPDTATKARISPQDYLEKIFQITFWLEPMSAPRAARYLESLVRSNTREGEPLASPAVSKVDISALELDYMRALAAYVGPSPRRVKRLVNVYRMIKMRLSDAQLGVFLTDRDPSGGSLHSGPYQIVIGLLVIGTGARTLGPEIIRELTEWDPTDSIERVVERFRGHGQPDWVMAAQVIEALMRTQQSENVAELRGWARRVERYLLHRQSARFG